MSALTYKYRIKDSTSGVSLGKMAGAINDVWNYCQEVSLLAYRRHKTFLSAYDLHKLTAGTSKELGLSADTIQQVCTEYVTRRRQCRKLKLKWRSRKRSLGWIPFKAAYIKLTGDTVSYCGHRFRLWLSRPVEGTIKTGSFTQDARGRWYVKEENDMVAPVRISLRIPGTAPMPQLMTLIQVVEAAGFDGAGILDSQLLCRDTFATMALAATQTSRLTLFPAVTNPFTRHASVLASAIQTVEELAPGRTKFVIGTGYTSASTIGRKPATLAQMRVCIRTVKTLLAAESVDFQGIAGRLGYATGRDIPVLMAASGPRAIELAGEIADGVLLLVGFTPGIVDAVLARLEQGAKRSGRRLEDLEIVWAVRTGTASTTAEAQRLARPTAVHWGILSWGNHWLPHAGLQIPTFEIPQEVLDIYPDLGHAHNWEEAIAATSFVPDDVVAQLCDALGLIGTPEYCAQRIMDMTKVGVTNLYLMPLQTFVGPEQEICAFRDVVFPRLRAEGYL